MSYQFKKVNNKSKQTYNLWFLLMTHCSFECSKNKRDYYRGEVCIKTCNFEKLKMSPLTDKKNLCKKKKKIVVVVTKSMIKLEITVITQEKIGALHIISVTCETN